MAVHVDPIPQRDLLFDFVGGTTPVYIGTAPAGKLTSDGAWLIRKVTYDGLNNPGTIRFANGSTISDQIWDNRAALTYP